MTLNRNVKLKCPNCGHNISQLLEESLLGDLKSQMNQDMESLRKEKIKNDQLTRKLVKEKEELDKLIAKQVKSQLKEKEAEIKRQSDEEHRLTVMEYQLSIHKLNQKLAETRRLAESVSQERQGTVQEILISDLITQMFPGDTIQRAKKGQAMADVLWEIRISDTKIASILVESKRTQSFSSRWVDKLKLDNNNQSEPSDQLVLITQAMPKEFPKFGLYDGVWVCQTSYAKWLLPVLRYAQLKVHEAAMLHNDLPVDELKAYLSSNEFESLVERTIKGFATLMKMHNDEKIRFEKLVRGREKIISDLIQNNLNLLGGLKVHAKGSFPEIESLEFQPVKISA